MHSTEPTVVLGFAFRWGCPSCGAANYHSGVPAKMTDEERAEAAEYFGVPIDCPLVSAPPFVTCTGCFKEFAARDPSQLEDDDDLE